MRGALIRRSVIMYIIGEQGRGGGRGGRRRCVGCVRTSASRAFYFRLSCFRVACVRRGRRLVVSFDVGSASSLASSFASRTRSVRCAVPVSCATSDVLSGILDADADADADGDTAMPPQRPSGARNPMKCLRSPRSRVPPNYVTVTLLGGTLPW